MFKNFLLTAYRSLTKHKGYTILNVMGLSAGLTCFAFIAVWVSDELSYDKFNKKADRIVRIVGKVTTESEVFDQAVTCVPMAAALKSDYPQVERTVRFDNNDATVKKGDIQFAEDGIVLTDPSFFEVFDYPLKEGNAKTALNDPYSIILTEKMAQKYFGKEDPVGRYLTLVLYDTTGKGLPYKITGVIPDPPKNAHFTFNFLGSFKTLEAADPGSVTQEGWGSNGYYTYLLLKDKSDFKTVAATLPQFIERHLGKEMKEWKMRYDYTLQPLTGIHLRSHLRYEFTPTGNIEYVYIFSLIGIFILLIAGINYMNLATARSLQRAKEVGVKKVLGAARSQLVIQYLVEAIVVAIFSLILALLLTSLLDPLLQKLSGKSLSVFNSPQLIAFLTVVTFLLGLISGIYPAFFITAYKPGIVLKGAFKSSTGGVWLRKALVVVQFTISVALLIGIFVVNSQLSFIQHKDLGYNKDALVALRVNGDAAVINGFTSFKNSLLSNPLVKGVTTSNSLLVGGLGNSGASTVTGDGKAISSSTYRLRVDNYYMDVYGMKLLAGRNFSSDPMNDTAAFILNEAAVKAFSWGSPEAAINKPFSMGGSGGRVVGIVKDFHFNSLQHPVEPLAIAARGPNNRFSQITVKIDMSRPGESIKWIQKNWKSDFPGSLLQYDFLDKKLNDQYQAEERFSKFFLYFSFLSLLIACLGLFGLTTYAIQQRTKEIGIRKVLGATVNNIVSLLSKDFLKLVIVAAFLAFPLAWWTMNKWLKDFAYRISIGWWVFAEAALIVLLIAFVTISLQVLKAVAENPVKSLRTE